MRNGQESPSFWWADTNVRLWHVPAVPHRGDSSAVEGRAAVFWLVPRAAGILLASPACSRARDRRGEYCKGVLGQRPLLRMFVGESNQHPEHLLATSDRRFKCTSNGRAITDYSEMM